MHPSDAMALFRPISIVILLLFLIGNLYKAFFTLAGIDSLIRPKIKMPMFLTDNNTNNNNNNNDNDNDTLHLTPAC